MRVLYGFEHEYRSLNTTDETNTVIKKLFFTSI